MREGREVGGESREETVGGAEVSGSGEEALQTPEGPWTLTVSGGSAGGLSIGGSHIAYFL